MCTHTHACMHAHMCAYSTARMHTCVPIHAHTCTHRHVHTCTMHTHTHMHMHTSSPQLIVFLEIYCIVDFSSRLFLLLDAGVSPALILGTEAWARYTFRQPVPAFRWSHCLLCGQIRWGKGGTCESSKGAIVGRGTRGTSKLHGLQEIGAYLRAVLDTGLSERSWSQKDKSCVISWVKGP